MVNTLISVVYVIFYRMLEQDIPDASRGESLSGLTPLFTPQHYLPHVRPRDTDSRQPLIAHAEFSWR